MRMLALLAVGLFTGYLFAADDKKGDDTIIGTWEVVRYDKGEGVVLTGDKLPKMVMTYKKGGKLIWTMGSEKDMEVDYKVDSTAKPKALDVLTGNKEQDSVGVFEVDGDTLTVAMNRAGRTTRPTEFKADGKGIQILTFKRVKDEKKDK